jgi:hypothetical protein
MVFSSLLTMVFYLAAGAVLVITSGLKPDSLTGYSGPIQVRIGSPDGLDAFSSVLPRLGGGTRSASATPASSAPSGAPPVTPPVAPPAAPPAAPAAATPVPGASATTEGVVLPPAKTAPAAAKTPPAGAALPTPAAGGTPAGAASSSPGQASAGGVEGEGIPSGSLLGSGSVSLKGSEQGNSFQTNYETGSGKIGRSLYVPIFLYMPLPKTVSKAVYDAIPPSQDGLRSVEVRKVEFRSFYEATAEGWRLKTDPQPAQRPSLWLMLRDAGYPLAKAEYKSGKTLKPVVLQFEVGPPQAEKGPELLSVIVLSSSGYADLDAAVVFGFRQAAFFNDSQASVTGKFTYWFE